MSFDIVSWPMLVLALVVFGFAPGFVLRLIVLAYPKGDPRRHELRGEMYHVPRFERPFWVMEQLELALIEGVAQRILWAATGRVIHRWRLGSGVRRNREHPETFWIPSTKEREAIRPGMDVKLMYETKSGPEVRMWVTVTQVRRRKLVGKLVSVPVLVPHLMLGGKVKFKRDHIIDTWDEPELANSDLPPDPSEVVHEEGERRNNDPSILN